MSFIRSALQFRLQVVYPGPDGELGRYRALPTDSGGRRRGANKALHTTVQKVETTSDTMRNIKGLYWPKPLYEQYKEATMGKVATWESKDGILGITLAKVPGEFVPLGVYKCFGDKTDSVVKAV